MHFINKLLSVNITIHKDQSHIENKGYCHFVARLQNQKKKKWFVVFTLTEFDLQIIKTNNGSFRIKSSLDSENC